MSPAAQGEQTNKRSTTFAGPQLFSRQGKGNAQSWNFVNSQSL